MKIVKTVVTKVSHLKKTLDSLDGIGALVGSQGGLSVIEGDIENSSAIPGCIRIETEHGTIYADKDSFLDLAEVILD